MLKVDDVSVSYGKSQVVYNVSFEIKDDEKLILLGRNGVGKTTLLKSIIGLLQAKTGDISLNSDKVTKLKPYERSRKGIAYVPQGREIIPQLTVQENLELGALAHKVDYAKKVEESGGQQQQLAIARALMSDPKILILDEPTEGIQPNIVSDIADILTRYHKEKKVPIIVVEQNLRFARKLGDRFLIMQKGSIVAQGQMDELTDELSKKYMSV